MKTTLSMILCLFLLTVFPLLLLSQPDIKNFNVIVQNKGQKIKKQNAIFPVKIAFATPLKQVSDYWRRSIDSFQGRMEEIGLEYVVKEFSTKADENRKLSESIQAALKIDPDYLVVTLNDPGDKIIISRLLGNEKVKVIIQNTTIPDEDWKETPPLMYVGFDHTLGTRFIADEYINRFKEEKHIEYAMLYFIKGSQVSKLRGDFFNEIMAEHTKFSLVAEYYTEGSRATAKNATLKILEDNPDIKFIYACSTDIAFGILDALKEHRLTKKILVNGWGGGAGELDSLLSGGLDFTVMRMNDDNGVAMAEAVRLDLESTLNTKPLIFSGEMVIVRQGISQEEIFKLKKRAFRYSDTY